MARSADEIVALFEDRRKTASEDRERMRTMCALYNNDIAIPLPELQRDELPAVVNLAKQGINQLAQRLGGVMPVIRHVERDYGRRDTARKAAELRRKVNYGWWEANRMNLQLRKRGRFMFAYASSPTIVRPDFRTGMPRWEQRSPLDTYAAPRIDVTDFRPLDAIFAQIRTVSWVRDRYPEAAGHFAQRQGDDLVDIIEYFDADEIHYVACLKARAWWEVHEQASGPGPLDLSPAGGGVTLSRVSNRAGMSWVTIAGNICLDKPVGQFDGLVGMYQAQAQLQALSLIARTKGVFMEEWLVSEDESTEPQVIRKADAMTGEVGIVRGGRFERVMLDPQYATDTGIDRLERAQRVEAGIPADFGGEAGSNVRTGRRAVGLIEQAVDPMLQEAHEIIGVALEEENRTAIAIDKAYWRSTRKTIAVSWGVGKECEVEYVPSETWETDRHSVRYPIPGADVHGMNIATGQAVGLGVMSKETAQKLNPLIENPEAEKDRIVAERLEEAFLGQLQMMASTPGAGLEPIDLARLIELVQNDKADLVPAFLQVQREAQERQAAQVPPGAPEAMPGVSPPGQGVESSIGPTQDQEGLSSLLYQLTAPQMARRSMDQAPVPMGG